MALYVTLEDGRFDLPGAGSDALGLIELAREAPAFDEFFISLPNGNVRIERVLVALPDGHSFLTESVF
jgi:hypothetical protein